MEDKELSKEFIRKTLGQGDDRYYVYMLCNAKNGVPFYIGKGEGGRIWQHEEDAHAEEEEIEYEVRKFKAELKLNKSLSDKEKKEQVAVFRTSLENELSKKHQKINSLGADNVTKVIVKWGLTEQEAYMAESALINMCKFYEGGLTNIVNGHMSQKEKDNRYCKTEAQTIEEFETNCAEPEKSLTDILKAYFGEDYTDKTAKDGCGILFLTINNLYPYCNGEPNKILDAASGFWKVNDEKIKNIEYVFALYRSKIVGIYPVNEDSWIQKKDLEKIYPDTGKATAVLKEIDPDTGNVNETKKELQLPLALEDFRKEEYEKIKHQIENGTLENGNRRMFFEANLTSEEDKNRFEALREFCGKYISLPRDPGARNPIYYNFKANGEFKKKKTN